MSPGSVLVIDDDEWVGRLLAVALRESGYEVHISVSAVEGYEKAVEMVPDCIICDVDLPDVDGFWVARKIRMSPDKVSITPILFLSGLDDRDTRLQGFHVGADVYMTKPFRIDEVVAQVGALVQMASRLRQSRKTFLSIPPTEAAMQGDLAQMSVATVLTLLDMERRSGKLEVSSKEQKAVLSIISGAIGSATLGAEPREPLELLRTLLTWNVGRFAFHPDSSEAAAPREASINALLMEAVRLEDELREGIDGQQAESSGRRSSRVARLVQSNAPNQGTSNAPSHGISLAPGAVAQRPLPDIEKGWSEPPPAMKSVPLVAPLVAKPPAVPAPVPTPRPATPVPTAPSPAAATPSPPAAATPSPPAAATPSPPAAAAAPVATPSPPMATPSPKPAAPPPPAPKPPGAKPGLVPPSPPGPPKTPFKPFGSRGSGAFPATTPAKPAADATTSSTPPKPPPPAPQKAPPPPPPQAPGPARSTPARVPSPPNPRVGQGSGDK